MQTEAKQDDEAEDEAFLKQIIRPEEDRRRYTSTPWCGGYRWFRSPNVIPIEHGRRLRSSKQQATD